MIAKRPASAGLFCWQAGAGPFLVERQAVPSVAPVASARREQK